jgi:flagellin
MPTTVSPWRRPVKARLQEVNNNLQRIRELAVQSVNATNSDSDRAALDLEVQQRLQEIDRIAQQTSFNGRNVLDGSFGSALFQVGANVGETIGLSLNTSVRTAEIGATASAASLDLAALVGNESGASGALTDAVSQAVDQAADGEAFSFTVGGVEILSEQQTNLTAAAGAYTAASTGAGNADANVTVSVSLSDASGSDFSTVAFSATSATGANETVTAAALDTALSTALSDGTLEGFTTTGDFANGTLRFIREDGQQFTVNMTTTTGGTVDAAGNIVEASTGGANLAAGVDSLTGPQLTVDDAAIDNAITSSLASLNAAGISVSGTSAGDDLTFSRADGEAFDITIENDFDTLGGFAGGDAFGSGGNLSNGTITIDNAADLVLAAGDLTIQVGTADAVNVTGTFGSVSEVLDGVKEALGGNASATLDADGNSFTIVAGENLVIAGAQVDSLFSAVNQNVEASGSIADVNVLTVAGSNDLISRVDASLSNISDLRSTFGAIQNRFESTIANLATTTENLTASRSRIQDADFAAETAALTRAQILQQAGIAVLAQANAQPQNVLALLQ